MKLFVAIAIVAVFGSACTVPNDSSIRFLGAHPLTYGPSSGGNCAAQTIGIFGGTLDISGYGNYLVQFNLESSFQSIQTTVPPDTVASSSRNDFVAQSIVWNYTSTPSLSFQSEQQDIYFVVKAGASQDSFLRVFLLTPNAASALYAGIQPGDLSGINVVAQFQVFGELASGQKIHTNKVSFPINVYNSGFRGCRIAGDVRIPSGPCGLPGGQDGTLVGCCKDFTPAPPGCT